MPSTVALNHSAFLPLDDVIDIYVLCQNDSEALKRTMSVEFVSFLA